MKKLLYLSILALAAFGQQPPIRAVVCTDAGTTDAYACTPFPAVAAYTAGMFVVFKPNTANVGAATLAISGLLATTITKQEGGITTVLADNDLRAGQYVLLAHDGTNFQMLSQIGNAPAGGGSVANYWTSTGLTGIGPTTFVPATGSTLQVRDATAATGATRFIVQAGAGDATGTKVVSIRNNTGAEYASITDNGTIAGQALVAGDFLANTASFSLPIDFKLRWGNGYPYYSTKDIGLERAAAGVLKVNDGGVGFGKIAVSQAAPTASTDACTPGTLWTGTITGTTYLFTCVASSNIGRVAFVTGW